MNESHEIIGTNLLFVLDDSKCKVIDLEKISLLPEHIMINHESVWTKGSHEDGYLFGLDNLILTFKNLVQHHSDE